MLFTIGTKEFQQALEIMQCATHARIKNDSNGLYIKASSGNKTVELEGNNYEIQMKVVFKQDVSESGEINVLAPQLLNIVKAAPSALIDVRFKENQDRRAAFSITEMSKNNNAYFPVRPCAEFPKIEKGDEELILKLHASAFLELMKNVAFAASEDKNKYTYYSLLLECNKNSKTILAGATDTKQMAMETYPITEDELIENARIVIPLNIVNEVIKILEGRESKDIIEVYLNPNKTKISFLINKIKSDKPGSLNYEPEQIYLKTSLIQCNYPSLSSLVKELPIKKIAVNAQELKAAINFVNPLSRETKYNVMYFDFKQNEIEVYVTDEMGISKTSVPCQNENTEEIHATFNCRLINKCVNQLSSETLLMQPDKRTPMQVRIKGNDNFIYILAPMLDH